MALPSQVILYVSDPSKSAEFYAALLGVAPATLSPNFVVFPIAPGFTVALLRRSTVEPAPHEGVSSELCFIEPDAPALEALHRAWVKLGVRILFAPKLMYFGGVNFLAEDPDGNRLRVSTPDK